MRNPIGAANDLINIGDDLSKANPTDLSHIAQDAYKFVSAVSRGDVGGAVSSIIDTATDTMKVPNLWNHLQQLSDDC